MRGGTMLGTLAHGDSWFPLVDRNPQKFVNIYKATEADFQKATERVYFGSHLTVPRLR